MAAGPWFTVNPTPQNDITPFGEHFQAGAGCTTQHPWMIAAIVRDNGQWRQWLGVPGLTEGNLDSVIIQ